MTDELRYTPEKISARNLEDTVAELERELWRISNMLNLIMDGYDPVTYAAPSKPRTGMRRNADGTVWNPGSGAGLYEYRGGAWVKL